MSVSECKAPSYRRCFFVEFRTFCCENIDKCKELCYNLTNHKGKNNKKCIYNEFEFFKE